MRPLESEIYIDISIHEDMSTSEIIKKIQEKTPKTSRITIFRAIKNMKNQGLLNHGKIIGKKGKRARYSINEDNTKKDLTMRVFENKGKKQKRIIPNPKVTQRNLSSLITENIQFYKQELKKLKKEPDINYYTFHISVISDCLAWITQLTLAINSGMLGDSTNKLELAKRNKERYEEFLQTLIYNIKTKNEKIGNNIVKAIYNVLVDKRFMEEFIS